MYLAGRTKIASYEGQLGLTFLGSLRNIPVILFFRITVTYVLLFLGQESVKIIWVDPKKI